MAEGESRAGMRAALTVAALAIALGLALLADVSNASAEVSFCTFGTAAGKCLKPTGVAADTSSAETGSGNVYVADRGNNRIDAFDPEGHFLFAFGWGVDASNPEAKLQSCTTITGCLPGTAGAGPGQLSGPRAIAVDNQVGSLSRHDVYVFDAGNFRVEKFGPEGQFLASFGSQGSGLGQFGRALDPVAVGPGGIVYVGDTVGEATPRVEKFEPNGAFLEAVGLSVSSLLENLSVDETGEIYATFGAALGLIKFNSAGAHILTVEPGANYGALAIDGEGDVLASQSQFTVRPPFKLWWEITRLESNGTVIERLGYGHLSFSPEGLASFVSVGGDVLATEPNVGDEIQGNRVVYLSLPAPGPLPIPPSLEASPVGNTKATLNAEVNPEGKPTALQFEYISEADYQADGESYGAGTITTPSIPVGGEDFALYYKAAEIGCSNPVAEAGEPGKCLVPETKYRFRAVASNSDGANSSEGTPFETAPPLKIEGAWATGVGTDAALLHGEVNPFGIPTTGYFEYVDDAHFQESGFADAVRVPAEGSEPLDFGSGEEAAERTIALSGLSPGTTYHYRLVATDPLIEPSPGPVTGPERTLRTFLASSPQTGCENESVRSGASAFLPDCRAYEMVSPLKKENGDVLAIDEPFTHLPAGLDESATSGDKLTYSSYRAFAEPESAPYSSQYIAARGTEGWESHSISPPKGTLDLIVASSLDTEFKAFSPDLCESWLRTITEPPLTPAAVPHYTNLYRRTDSECGEKSYEALTTVTPANRPPHGYAPLELQGVTADGSKALYGANGQLTPEAPDVSGLLLYEWAGGSLHFICLLPDGTPVTGPCTAGFGGSNDGKSRSANVSNAFSANGSSIYWSAGGKIYQRLNPDQEQSAIAGGECTEAQKACTVPVSAPAEALSSTSSSKYWGAAADGSRAIFTTGNDLYEYEAATAQDHLIAHRVGGVMGMSEDATRVYFPSEEVLGGPNSLGDSPVSGQPNLYLYHGGSFVFVGTLAKDDVGPWYGSATVSEPRYRSARVSADGTHAAFMSTARLTGYDNTDASSGEADSEVFLFDAAANGGEGSLVCASCDPSGGRPVGRVVKPTVGVSFGISAELPVWENTLYAARVLSQDGSRLYFDSLDSLSPQDTNGVGDVYEWEQAGAGSCRTASSSYSAADGGCVNLISSGQNGRESEFVDASPDGHDVFFTTLASLVPQDYGLIDVYDARVDGGFPAPPSPPASCEGEACQPAAQAPEYKTPASASLHGPGNVTEPQQVHCPKGKVKKQGKCVKKAKKPKAKKHKRHAKHGSGGKK